MDEERGFQESAGERRPLRPFPAIDPEPDHRFTGRSVLRAAAVCAAAGAVAAAVLLLWPAPGSRSAPAQARLAGGDGLVVFEEQPTGLLGTAAPDGSHRVILKNLGGLQGTDLPVASGDRRHLVNQEGQLVTMGPRGPVSVTDLSQSAQSNQWLSASFADGGRYVAEIECDTVNGGFDQDLVARLLPTAAGRPETLGAATWSAGDPSSAAALLSVPAGASGVSGGAGCFGPSLASDRAIELLTPGQPRRTVVTAGTLLRAVGWPRNTPVQLAAVPSPDASLLYVSVIRDTPTPAGAVSPNHLPVALVAAVLVSRRGAVVSRAPLLGRAGMMQWSPDGRRVAGCPASPGRQSRVLVWTVGGAVRTIALPGRHDVACTQLLWSPDGSQLIYAAAVTERGLTASARLQHGWTVIDLRTGQAHDVTAPGQPAAWLASPRGPASGGPASGGGS